MSKRLYSFLVVLLLIFSGELFAQFEAFKIPQTVYYSSIYTKMGNPRSKSLPGFPQIFVPDKKNEKYVSLKPLYIQLSPHSPINPISQSLYADALGFVCKKEWQLEKITTVPFRFRLGSLDYVNFLEQKPNAIKVQ